LLTLAGRHASIGDVRGAGLFIGMELVRPGSDRAPDPDLANYLVNALRERRILISATGPKANVLKIRPPLVFGSRECDVLIEAIDELLSA
jgi:4-aminobutyrate aminotransferase-like enzyme